MRIQFEIYMYILLIASFAWCKSAIADHIRFSQDIVNRFAYKDWVAYQTKREERGTCRPESEFVIDGTLATFAILDAGFMRVQEEQYYVVVFGEYVKSFEVYLDGNKIEPQGVYNTTFLSDDNLNKLANGKDLKIHAILYTEYSSKNKNTLPTKLATGQVSLAGSSAALRFCGFIK